MTSIDLEQYTTGLLSVKESVFIGLILIGIFYLLSLIRDKENSISAMFLIFALVAGGSTFGVLSREQKNINDLIVNVEENYGFVIADTNAKELYYEKNSSINMKEINIIENDIVSKKYYIIEDRKLTFYTYDNQQDKYVLINGNENIY